MTDERSNYYSILSYAIVDIICAVFVLLLMVLINAQVLLSALAGGVKIPIGHDFPLLSDYLTINSFIDLQWHLLLVIAFFPMGLLLVFDRHIRVDVFHSRMRKKIQYLIDAIGHIFVGLPFLVLMVPSAWSFFLNSWRNGEGSALGGLQDYYIIKFVLFVGLSVFTLFVSIDAFAKFRNFTRKYR